MSKSKKVLSVVLSFALLLSSAVVGQENWISKADAVTVNVDVEPVDEDITTNQQQLLIPLNAFNHIDTFMKQASLTKDAGKEVQKYMKNGSFLWYIEDLFSTPISKDNYTSSCSITFTTEAELETGFFSGLDFDSSTSGQSYCSFTPQYINENFEYKNQIEDYEDMVLDFSISGKAANITSAVYTGDKLTLNYDVPDIVRPVFVNLTTSSLDDGSTVYTLDFTASNYYVTDVAQAFNKSWIEASTNRWLSLSLPERVTDIDESAFSGNTKLTRLTFDADAIQSVGENAFASCINLKELDLTSLDSALNTIPDRCFYQCNSLENIKITKTTLNIGREAFYQCDKVDFFLIPNSVQTIGENAFSNCSNLRYIYIASNYQNWEEANIVSQNELYKLLTGTVPSPIVSTEKAGGAIGSNVFSGGKLYVYSPVDIIDIKVTKDGVALNTTAYDSTTYPLSMNTKYKTQAYEFDGSQKGIYNVIATDVLGNVTDKTFSYNSDVDDKTSPKISGVADGKSTNAPNITVKDDETYLTSVVVSYEDKGIEKTLTDGQQEYTFKSDYFNLDGYYTVSATDLFGNKSTVSFYVDKSVPTIQSSIKENEITSDSVELNFSDMGKAYNIEAYNTTDNMYRDLNAPDMSSFNYINEEDTNTYMGSGITKITVDGVDKTKDLLDKTVIPKTNNIKTGILKLVESGKHTVIVTDAAGNSSQISFTINRENPQLEGITNNSYYNKNITLKYVGVAGVVSNCAIGTLEKPDGSQVDIVYSDGDVLKDEGRYNLTITDKAGLSTSYNFIIDKTAPKIKGVKSKGIYKTDKTIKVDDANPYTLTVNKSTDESTEYTLEKSKKYTITAVDKAGNKTTVSKVIVDKAKPKCNVKAKTYKKKVTIKASDKLSGVKKITLNGKKIKNKKKVTKRGKYKLIVTDKAGNKLSVKFKIK